MPEIREIDEFKNEFIRLGNEPEIRSERGESLPDITVPESRNADDLSALFDEPDLAEGDFAGESGVPDDLLEGLFGEPEGSELDDLDFGDEEPSEPLAAEPEAEADAEPDFEAEPDFGDAGFGEDDVFEEPAVEPETELSGELPVENGFGVSDEDLGADFGDLDSLDLGEEDSALEGFSSDEAPSEAEAESVEEFSDFEEAGEDDFSLPEGLTDGFAADLEPGPEEDENMFDDFDLGEVEEAEEIEDVLPEVPEPDDGESGDFSFDSDFPDIEEPSMEFDPDSTSEETAGIEDFDEVAGFDSLDMSDDDFDLGADDGFTDAELPGDSVDEFSFDDGDLAAGGDEPSDEGLSDDDFSLEDFSLGEIDGDDIEATEFSLGDLGQEFGLDDAEDSEMAALEDIDISPSESGMELPDAFDDDSYAIPDDEYIELKKSLGRMPRNLKILIEELIGEKNLAGENLDKLLKALIKGASAKEVASIVSKITGKKVKIPLQYERRTAEEFEREKSTFGYAFRKNFIPMFRTAALVAAALGLLLFIGFRFIYTPLHAESLYKRGYEEIYAGNNGQANSYFDRAFSEWQKKDWFYDYAEGFAENKQYILAEEKYEQLLRVYDGDRQGILDYASLEFKTLGKYPEAEKLLKGLLFDDQFDYDARLMLGDTYMEWAREIEPELYEEARFNYAKLLEQYGGKDSLLFRMMRYFIRTDNYTEAMNLYEAFNENPRLKIEPDIYAELAGYLIDRNHMEDVREILIKAREVEEDLPEVHYELARYFDILDIPTEEEKALLAAIWLFENTSPLTRTRNGFLIDSYNRYGKILYSKDLYLDAEDYFRKAVLNYEEALANGQLKPDPKYGTIYSNLGDLAYYISGDYDQALSFFRKAEDNGYSPRELKYKKGFVYYNNEEYREALVEFYDTAGGFSVDRQLLYSTANTLFNRNDYYLAEGYYTHLKDLLEKEYSSINYLLIDEIPEHRVLLENMMKVSNNLGVTKYRLYERSRDPEKNAEAMVLLTDATEYYDKLVRDPDLLIEPETVNLSYLNSKAVFYPVPDYRPQIYQDIPKDLTRMDF